MFAINYILINLLLILEYKPCNSEPLFLQANITIYNQFLSPFLSWCGFVVLDSMVLTVPRRCTFQADLGKDTAEDLETLGAKSWMRRVGSLGDHRLPVINFGNQLHNKAGSNQLVTR